MLKNVGVRLTGVTSRIVLGVLLAVGMAAAAEAQTIVMKLSTAARALDKDWP